MYSLIHIVIFGVIYLNSLISTVSSSRMQACNLLIGIDEPLWIRYNKNMTAIREFVNIHVDNLNEIFIGQLFTDSFYDDVYFRLKRINIVFGTCEAVESQRKNCTTHRDLFLKSFDEYDFSDFCLAYLFSYQDFSNGTAGYASVGTVCNKKYNSGFITLLNYGIERSINDSVITFAHEVGHSFAALHDNYYNSSDPDCIQHDFIMNEVYNITDVENESSSEKFSNCSIREMKKKLEELYDSGTTCFESIEMKSSNQDLEIAICGDGKVDPGEECDCGNDWKECSDFCCYPAHIYPPDRLNDPKAKPCHKAPMKFSCNYPPALVYGVYLPLSFIILVIIFMGLALNFDWKRNKNLFTHITKQNVRIIKSNQFSSPN